MTMDIGHLRGFLFSVVKTSPHCLFAPCLGLWTIFVVYGPHPANDEKRHHLYKKKKRTLKNLNLWMDEEYL